MVGCRDKFCSLLVKWLEKLCGKLLLVFEHRTESNVFHQERAFYQLKYWTDKIKIICEKTIKQVACTIFLESSEECIKVEIEPGPADSDGTNDILDDIDYGPDNDETGEDVYAKEQKIENGKI